MLPRMMARYANSSSRLVGNPPSSSRLSRTPSRRNLRSALRISPTTCTPLSAATARRRKANSGRGSPSTYSTRSGPSRTSMLVCHSLFSVTVSLARGRARTASRCMPAGSGGTRIRTCIRSPLAGALSVSVATTRPSASTVTVAASRPTPRTRTSASTSTFAPARVCAGRLHVLDGEVAVEAFASDAHRVHRDAARPIRQQRVVIARAAVVGAIGHQHHAGQGQSVQVLPHLAERAREVGARAGAGQVARAGQRRRVGAEPEPAQGEPFAERARERGGVVERALHPRRAATCRRHRECACCASRRTAPRTRCAAAPPTRSRVRDAAGTPAPAAAPARAMHPAPSGRAHAACAPARAAR